MSEDRLRYLFHRYFDKTALPEERDELMRQLKTAPEEVIAELMEEAYQRFEPGEHIFIPRSREGILSGILEDAALHNTIAGKDKDPIFLPARKMSGWKWMAAAMLALTFLALAWLFLDKRSRDDRSGFAQSERYRNDVAPGGETATLTLANGTSISLEDAKEGSLALQGNVRISKPESGSIAYEEAGNTGDRRALTAVYNKLSTPRGGHFKLTLPDGTRVWLNSASSIRYPVAFGKERRVEISGEVYLEVAKNAQSPFKVLVSGNRPGKGEPGNEPVEITVLGTHFNVTAYPGEPVVKTTLLEGSVKVARGNASSLLEPGQQASIKENGAIQVAGDISLQEVTAWKEGYFQFEDASIETIMKQVSRWYNVEVHYQGAVSKRFSVLMFPRNLPVSRLLELLEFTGNVQFEIEGRRITVMP